MIFLSFFLLLCLCLLTCIPFNGCSAVLCFDDQFVFLVILCVPIFYIFIYFIIGCNLRTSKFFVWWSYYFLAVGSYLILTLFKPRCIFAIEKFLTSTYNLLVVWFFSWFWHFSIYFFNTNLEMVMRSMGCPTHILNEITTRCFFKKVQA